MSPNGLHNLSSIRLLNNQKDLLRQCLSRMTPTCLPMQRYALLHPVRQDVHLLQKLKHSSPLKSSKLKQSKSHVT